ncbi:MAG: hypothetical protein ACKO96_30900, partial [Flammeovirgaceae bacterium]
MPQWAFTAIPERCITISKIQKKPSNQSYQSLKVFKGANTSLINIYHLEIKIKLIKLGFWGFG